MKKGLQLVITLAFVCWAASAGAHSLWLNMDNHTCQMGQTVTIDIGWGHKFPKDTEIREGMLKEAVAIDPKGEQIPLKEVSRTVLEFVPPAEGVYVISASVHPGFVSRTTQGYRMGPKTGLDKVISCFHYDIRTKTFVLVGDRRELPVHTTGDPLEIIPLTDPFGLKQGSDLLVRVQFNGAPLAGAKVFGTYAGFSDEPNVFAQTVETDKDGTARIKLQEKGKWMVSVTHEIPYPDTTTCDTNKFNATMTVDVP